MNFRKTLPNSKTALFALIVIGTLQGCNWDDKYSVVDCSDKADPNVVDCRSEGATIDNEQGETGIADDSGTLISFERDITLLQPLTETDSASWSATHEDQLDLLVRTAGDQIFVGSKYHNYLRSFQSDALGQLTPLDAAAFLDVSGARHEIDAVTGASEQVFNHLSLNTDGSQTILIAQAEKYDSESSGTGVGVYIEPLPAPGTLPDVRFASGGSHNFISYSAIRASTNHPDGTQIAVTGDDRSAKVYQSSDYSTEAVKTRLRIRGSSITYSDDAETLYVGGLALTGAVVALASDDLSARWTINVADKPVALLPEASGGVVAVLASGSSVYWLPKNGDQARIVNIPIATQASAAAIDSEGKILVAADTDQGIDVISLQTGQRAHTRHNAAIQAVAIDGFGTVWVVSQQSLKGYRLPDSFE
ncbi:MAG: hypothetical protein CSA50_04270 [Gammaproteobacteria bacterium]|nr:MAG: hypothetical protein CSA50_04270 [Gammaproteobacteria bacterium]